MSTPAKPVFQFAAAPPERQRRWGVLLRLFVAIPQLVFAVFMIYAAFILTFFAWFYMIFTGRNPFFEFSSKAELRFVGDPPDSRQAADTNASGDCRDHSFPRSSDVVRAIAAGSLS
ncbi:MAG TPA: hypothetical protein VG246_03385, partial [Acidimicrobiales bacterium]|nr:hypothetical protein [Acidimicrobiales bacterium]